MRHTILFALLALGSFFIYAPGIHGPFIFDDITSISNNPLIQVQQLDAKSLYSASTSGHSGPLKRPIPMLSFALNYYFAGGYDSTTFKITNVVIHCINAFLVFMLCLQVFKRISSINQNNGNANTAFWFASAVSLLWVLHPINLTSVLYVVQRMTSLSTLFSLSCIILYLAARNQSITKPFSWRIGSLFFASLVSLTIALFSKENAILIPLIILLIELTLYSSEKPSALFNALSKRSRQLVFGGFFILGLLALAWSIDYASGGFNGRPFTMLERLLTETRVLCLYLSLIIIPRINEFGLFHDDIALSTSLLSPWTTITSIIFIASLLATAFYYRKKNPLFSLGIGWFFIGHLLESTFFPLEITHEHRNNLPSIGIILAMVSLIPSSLLSSKKMIAILTAIALILGGTTWLRAKQWASYSSLAYYESSHHPNSPAIQALLSNAANQTGHADIAIQAINKAMELDPKETAYAIYSQKTLSLYGKPIPAELQEKTLNRIKSNRLTPSTLLALSQIANCLTKKPCLPLRHNYIEWMNAVIQKAPNNANYYYFRGRAHKALNNNLAALNDFQTSHTINKTYLHPLFEMADILLRMGQISQANEVVTWIEKANEKTAYPRDEEIKQLKQLLATFNAKNTHSE